MILECITSGPFVENGYVLGDPDTKEGVIVDPGEGVDAFVAAIERHGLEPVAILNTHAHLDHIQGVAPLKKRYGIPFRLHPDDMFWIEAAAEQAAMFGLAPPDVPEVDGSIADGETFTVGSIRLEAAYTPGHTPGHVCFLGDGFVLAGDLLFAGSIGRVDLPGGSMETIARSIRERIYVLPDETVVHPGHGPATTVGAEKRSNAFVRA